MYTEEKYTNTWKLNVHNVITKQQRKQSSAFILLGIWCIFLSSTNLVVPAGHVQGCPPIRVPELQVQPGTVQQLTSMMMMMMMMMMMRVTWVQMITWLLVMASLRGSPPRQFTSAPSRSSLWNWAKSP